MSPLMAVGFTVTVDAHPKYGVTTTVQRGQTLYRIATDNGIVEVEWPIVGRGKLQ